MAWYRGFPMRSNIPRILRTSWVSRWGNAGRIYIQPQSRLSSQGCSRPISAVLHTAPCLHRRFDGSRNDPRWSEPPSSLRRKVDQQHWRTGVRFESPILLLRPSWIWRILSWRLALRQKERSGVAIEDVRPGPIRHESVTNWRRASRLIKKTYY